VAKKWNPLLTTYYDSEKINSCCIGAETLYTRLLARCDRNGSYFATPEKINGRLFEQRNVKGETTPSIIAEWLTELENNELIRTFEDSGEKYLNIIDVFKCDGCFDKVEFPVPDFVAKKLADEEAKNAGLQALYKAADRVTDFLNETAKKHGVSLSYKHSSASRNVIVPRLREWVEYDLNLVVEHKCAEWLGDDKMRGFVRPITLFAPTKFEGYLNAARAWATSGKRQKGGLYRGQESEDDYGAVVR